MGPVGGVRRLWDEPWLVPPHSAQNAPSTADEVVKLISALYKQAMKGSTPRAFLGLVFAASLSVSNVGVGLAYPAQDIQQTLEPRLYAPFIASPDKFDVVSLYNTVPCDFPNSSCVFAGYVMNLTGAPVKVVLSMGVTWLYFPPGAVRPTVEETVFTTSTRFTATLPGLINPFHFRISVDSYRWWASPARLYSSSSLSNTLYWPLAVIHMSRSGDGFQGEVRNDTGRLIRQAQVVVFDRTSPLSGESCIWLNATLVTDTLAPGATTTFSATPPPDRTPPCDFTNPVPLAQGME